MTIMPRHFYDINADTGVTIRVLRDSTPPSLSAGGARWSVVEVPRRVSFTQWQGRDPFQLDVPILFNGYPDKSIENDCRKLTTMFLSPEFEEPPKITIDGALPISDRRWVIQGITWGSNVYWAKTEEGQPYRLRQDAVVHFLEYRPERKVHILATNTLPNFYQVPKGQTVTMRQIAKAIWGSARRWRDIKKANPNIRDPNHIKGPKRVRVP